MGSITNILLLIFFVPLHPSLHSNKVSADSSSAGCIEGERKALLQFKASVNLTGQNLIFGNGTTVDAPIYYTWEGHGCCSWDGVDCDSLTGHVKSLDFQLAFLDATLSPWLFHLEFLRLPGLKGIIPNMFNKLTSLTYLDLSGMILGSTNLFPDSLCSLPSLTYIDLSYSYIQGSLPFCLANLTSLATLNLDRNELSGEIPGTLGNLTHLTTLGLSYNHLHSSIPSTFGNLRNLQSLNLGNNKLSGAIPSTLGNLTKLEVLDVSDNFLTGELSESILEGLKSLKELHISRNHLIFNVSPQWIPPFQLSLVYADSVFAGTQIPEWLRSQRILEQLIMSNAGISGVIPDSFPTAHPNLNFIDFSNNLLSGSVPTFDCPSLSILQLSGNQLSGNIPQQLCNLTSLFTLTLGNNQLIGMIPPCLGALKSLAVLDLGNNSLSGHIPNELGSIKTLNYLHLNGNKLSGKLPDWLKNANSLITLDLGDNYLQDSIPNWIGKEWPYLAYLRLESNNFYGEIPINLCHFPSLQILNLALNNLVGTIPPCLGNLSMMLSNESGPTYGNMSYNEAILNIVKGREMEYTSSLSYAKFISLSGNHLLGQIPIELMKLTGLQSLNLSNNELTGIIPEAINKLESLESLDLSMNELSGTIPQSLADIDALSYLNLSFNNLAGKVPSGNHFDTLDDPSIYQGNMGLCGKLLKKRCPGDDSATFNQPNGPVADVADEFNQMSWVYAGIGPGFAVGLLAVICTLYFKDSWRIAYFGFADNLTIKISQFRRK